MAAKQPAEYTVLELKDILREYDLVTGGAKAELIQRLTEFDENIWDRLNAERVRFAGESREQSESNSQRVDETNDEVRNERTPRVALTEHELIARENELLRRERDILQRELDLARQGQAPRNSAGTSVGRTGRSSMSANENVKSVRDLLSEFNGSEGSFWRWEQQLSLLRVTYDLDDSSSRILISAKLKGRALDWFHSKPSHLILSVEDLLKEMKKMFDHRQSKLVLRKKFEERQWQPNEQFGDYYHDKVILANRVPIEEDEIIDYLIDGISDTNLQAQARIMRFKKQSDLLEAFEKVTLTPKKTVDRESKWKRDEKSTRGGKENSSEKENSTSPKETSTSTSEKSASQRRTPKCYNCREPGHIAPDCTKPKRTRGSCFTCGSTSHQKKDCPEEKSKSAPANAANMVEPISVSDPYYVELSFSVDDAQGGKRIHVVSAVVDPGSPVSLIKREYVPTSLIEPVPPNGNDFCGMNKSTVNVSGTFTRTVNVEGIDVEIRFLVVPKETMSCVALLGRDFSRNPSIRVELDESIKIVKRYNSGEGTDHRAQLMLINCVESPHRVNEELNIDPEVGHEMSKKLKVLYETEYISKWGSDDQVPEPEMIITVKTEQPITFRPRRLAFADGERVKSILDDLLKDGTIRPSESPYASPIVLVRKKNGETRLCVDYRELNKITVKDNFPAPLIDDHLDRLKDKKYFSSLDLKNGFYHVKMSESSIKYTAFVTPYGQYEYQRMPFGLTNAPRVFQRFVNGVFGKLIRENKVLLYLDDILIATKDLGEHFEILKEVFETARKHRLQFRLDKCFFARREITYLGYLINEHGIRPSKDNVNSVISYPVPRNTKEVHRFVCLASYFRRFIPDFSVIAKPLYDLVKKDVPFKFSAKELEVFETLKRALSSEPILTIFSPHLETELHCDASASGYGAILLQKQSDKIFRPVFYFSKRTTPTEAKYHSFELECLAAVYAIKRFHIYLAGIKFKIVTDCDSFRLTLSKKTINPRISRWALFLENYDYEIVHRPGSRMSHVDALSRCHSILIVEANTFERTLSIQQDRDEEILKIRDRLERNEDKYYEIRDGLVYRKTKDNKLLFYVPSSMEGNVIRTCHDDIGHVGVDKVVDNITKVYWFPRLKEKVKTYIANCLRCIEFSPLSGKSEGHLHSIEKGKLPFQTIHVDHLGPLEKTGRGYRHILSIVDAFTKYVKLYPCKSTTSEESIKHLRDYFRAYSKPKRVISDRGTAFTSERFKEFLSDACIRHVLVAVGTPRANGQVERFNRVVTPMIAKLCDDPSKWDQVLDKVEFAINNTVCRSTGETPSKLLFGIDQTREINDNLRQILESYASDERDLTSMRELASTNICKSQEVNERYYNKKHKEATIYREGDYVMIRNVDTTAGSNKKLIPKFKGPYVVKKVLDSDRYVVTDVEGFELTQLPYNGVIAVDQMKSYVHN